MSEKSNNKNKDVATEDMVIKRIFKGSLEFRQLTIEKLMPHKQNMFPPLDTARHEEFKENIAKNGLREAIIVCPVSDFGDGYNKDFPEAEYVILCGHKRFRAVNDLGQETIKAEIQRFLTEDEKMDMIIGSNIDRQSFPELPYSIQAKILKERQRLLSKEKRDAIYNEMKILETNGKTSDNIDGCQIDNGKRINEFLEEEYGIDDRKVARLLRMEEYLNESIFDKVDKKVIPFMAAHDLSFLTATEQKWTDSIIDDVLKENDSYKLNGKMAAALRKKHGKLSEEKVGKILNGQTGYKKNSKLTVTLGDKILRNYFDEGTTVQDIKASIEDALVCKANVNYLIEKYLSDSKLSEMNIENFVRFFKEDFKLNV